MKVGIMQPYFFPYLGYFQLMNAVDEFVLYDNIEFTKKGWINRNRILVNGKDDYITLPLKKDSDFLHVKDRVLAESWPQDRKKMLNKISGSYRKAPQFDIVFPLIEKVCLFEGSNLFDFIYHSIDAVKKYLDIPCSLVISSMIPIDHSLRSENKVIAICKDRKASTYINPIGGLELYNAEHFREDGIELRFIKMNPLTYSQFGKEFVPALSVIDVMMFNPREEIKHFLSNGYTLV